MGFAAVRLSNGEYDQKGFETEADADKYIQGLICNVCVSDLQKGFVVYDDGEKEVIASVLDTPCGAEWLIISDEDYDEAENVPDLFIAAGMTPSDENTKRRLTPAQLEKIRKRQEEREQEEKNED